MITVKLLKLDLPLVPCKVGSFLTNVFQGSYLPFMYVFFLSVGMTQVRAGILTAIMSSCSMFASPFWAYVADATKRRKTVLVVLSIISSASMFSIPWIVLLVSPLSSQCQQQMVNSTKKRLNGSSTNLTDVSLRMCMESNENITKLFHVLCAVVLFVPLFVHPLYNYMEAVVVNVCAAKKVDYGRQRVFGAIGFTVGNMVTGEASELFDVVDMSHYTPMFAVCAGCILILLPLGCFLIDSGEYGDSETNADIPTQTSAEMKDSTFKIIFRVCWNLDFALFIVTVFMAGLAYLLVVNFSLKYALDVFGRGQAVSSLVITMSAAGTVVIFPFSSNIISLFRGPIPTIIVCLLSQFIRHFVMSLPIPFEVFVVIQVGGGLALRGV